MLGLSPLGTLHTALALAALCCGFAMTWRHGRIGGDLRLGPAYAVLTALTCLTSLGLSRLGGFNIAHALGLLTLVVLAAAWAAGRRRDTSRPAAYVETLGYSATLFLHLVPGITESGTRLPLGAPLFAGPEDPRLQQALGAVLLAFLVGAGWQARRLARP